MTRSKKHARAPRCATIAPCDPFLPTLIEALFDGRLVPGFCYNRAVLEDNPFALADVSLFLPTRRAARALEALMLQAITALYAGKASAALLPNIRALGDMDEADLLLQENRAEPLGVIAGLPPALPELERHMALTEMVWTWSRSLLRQRAGLASDESVIIPANPRDAALLASDLARLLDEAENTGLDWRALKSLVPEDFSHYWQLSLSFLEIVTKHWPRYLAGAEAIDAVARRNRLIRAEAAALQARPPRGPVIAAGSTGSVPATASLLKAIARLPQGCVVLPGLDLELDEEAWQAIGAAGQPSEHEEAKAYGHPQFTLKRTLEHIGLTRRQVIRLEPERKQGAKARQGGLRARLINEALRPASCTGDWPQVLSAFGKTALCKALEDMALLEARSAQEEALAIALILRAALEKPPLEPTLSGGADAPSAALVTPDRALARRVGVELARFGIEADDSAGAPLFSTPAGALAWLCVEAPASGMAAPALLGLMKHPLAGFGAPREEVRKGARALERAVLRGLALKPGLAPIAEALERLYKTVHDGAQKPPFLNAAQQSLGPSHWQAAWAMAHRLNEAFAPFEKFFAKPEALYPFDELVKAHRALLQAVTAGPDTAERFAASPGGAALSEALGELAALQVARPALKIRAGDYGALLKALIGQRVIRPVSSGEARVHILGTLEARLLHMDTMVLAGLNEKTWPAETRLDPWLSRAMRAKLGLLPPEYGLGLSAHDFVQCSSQPRVFFTRTLRQGGAPTQGSRWLQRLKALIGEAGYNTLRQQGEPYLTLARRLDAPQNPAGKPAPRPSPRPEAALRPKRLSVTEIEALIRDPYAVYAKHVLRLKPFDPIAKTPDFAVRGSLIHDILSRFFSRRANGFDKPEALHELLAIGDEAFEKLAYFPDIYAHWRTRFKHMAAWLLEHEAARQSRTGKRFTERPGVLTLQKPPFCLTGRADRIDLLDSGQCELIDYKTGQTPSKKQIESYLAPQLPLEAAILAAGGFEDLPALACAGLSYIRLSGNQPPGVYQKSVSGVEAVAALAAGAVEKLQGLVAYYALAQTGYLSHAQPQYTGYEGPYDHLARVAEWRGGLDLDGEAPLE